MQIRKVEPNQNKGFMSKRKESRGELIEKYADYVLDAMAANDIYVDTLQTYQVGDVLEMHLSPEQLKDVDEKMCEEIVDFIKKNY